MESGVILPGDVPARNRRTSVESAVRTSATGGRCGRGRICMRDRRALDTADGRQFCGDERRRRRESREVVRDGGERAAQLRARRVERGRVRRQSPVCRRPSAESGRRRGVAESESRRTGWRRAAAAHAAQLRARVQRQAHRRGVVGSPAGARGQDGVVLRTTVASRTARAGRGRSASERSRVQAGACAGARADPVAFKAVQLVGRGARGGGEAALQLARSRRVASGKVRRALGPSARNSCLAHAQSSLYIACTIPRSSAAQCLSSPAPPLRLLPLRSLLAQRLLLQLPSPLASRPPVPRSLCVPTRQLVLNERVELWVRIARPDAARCASLRCRPAALPPARLEQECRVLDLHTVFGPACDGIQIAKVSFRVTMGASNWTHGCSGIRGSRVRRER